MTSALSKRKNSRHLAIQSLYEWQLSANDVLQIVKHNVEHALTPMDGEYYREVMFGIAEQYQDLDSKFAPHLARSLDEMDPVELAVLRLACYEMLHRLDIPYRVVINEALELAKRFGATDSHKFVNGVLDKLAKELRADEQRLVK